MLCDQHRLHKKLKSHQKSSANNQSWETLANEIEQSLSTRKKRLDNIPKPELLANLPIIEKKQLIADAIEKHQVIILCGETGSGKTTQLPQICLSLGRGVSGLIGHTQPRRIAARTVAARIADELKCSLGQQVGYQVRFDDKTNQKSYIKVMTDGILLTEIQHDRFLNKYDTLIIDEAHERTLNIDFLLGYLKWLLNKRPDLKLIITSATIDPDSFSAFFNQAPIIKVSGRTYPVDVLYRPIEEFAEGDMQQAVVHAVDEALKIVRGDILIFFSGEREIKEAADAINKYRPQQYEVLPLYARLSSSQQQKIFQSHRLIKIILATNIAETSITVPGIRTVIDTGLVRINRYSPGSQVQRLPIEHISQASANQRKGRCGRVSDGLCIRLYAEDEFNLWEEYTTPEIQRTSLASVILQMAVLKLANISHFPFISPPEKKYINDGYRLLQEIEALDKNRKMTVMGYEIAKLSIDPRLARMVVASKGTCAEEVAIIVSALAIQDPRERPFEFQQKADECHREFFDEDSDFLAFLNLWQFYRAKEQELSKNKLRQLCKKRFLSYMKMREWQEIYHQLTRQMKTLGYRFNQQEVNYEFIHNALLTGLLGQIGFKDEKYQYLGPRSRQFNLFPGSSLFKKQPKWLMAAHLVETTKLYARMAAKINPQWIEACASHLVKYHYYEPHWGLKDGRVIAYRQTLLYGLVINPRQKVFYDQIDAIESRKIFIQSALVEGDFKTKVPVFHENQQLLSSVELLEHKSRRQDVLVDDLVIFQFYDDCLPNDVNSRASFEQWYFNNRQKNSASLSLSKTTLMRHQADDVTEAQFPDSLRVGSSQFKLQYHFEPGHVDDGVSLILPLPMLNQIVIEPLEWLVPGLIKDKVIALIKGLPKPIRKLFVPVPNVAEKFVVEKQGQGHLITILSEFLKQQSGVTIEKQLWNHQSLADFYKINIILMDENNKKIDSSRDVELLRKRHGQSIKQKFNLDSLEEYHQKNLKYWSFDDLEDEVKVMQDKLEYFAYPALIDDCLRVNLQLFDNKNKSLSCHYQGLRRLFRLSHEKEFKYLRKNMPHLQKTCLLYVSVTGCKQLDSEKIKEEITDLIVASVFPEKNIRQKAVFETVCQSASKNLLSMGNDIAKVINESLILSQELTVQLSRTKNSSSVQGVKNQLEKLIYPGFLSQTTSGQLKHLPRYIKALIGRLKKSIENPKKDEENSQKMNHWWQKFQSIEEAKSKFPEMDYLRWMIEEYHVSLFAQELKTQYPISEKRLQKQLDKVIAL